MTSNDELERQRFEGWLKSKDYCSKKDGDGNYASYYVDNMWRSLLARSKQEQSDG
ncbi:hypothetical protein [Mixta calida]|uniref:hypothetical protein n=1 Tax=Mixta calida TaxID=665913 RepID=UPI00403AF682